MRKLFNAKNSDTQLILLLIGLFTFLRILTSIGMYWRMNLKGEEMNWGTFMQGRVIAWLVSILFIVVIVKTTRLFLFRKKSWLAISAIHLLIAVVLSVLWYGTFLLASMAIEYTQGALGSEKDYDFDILLWYLQNFDSLLIIILFTISLTYTYYYIQQNSLNQIQKSQIEQQLLQARLTVLKSQLQPHFLFNTLNSIASIMTSDLTRARDMLADLSHLLRHVLDSGERQTITLEEELTILNKYLDIEKTRFSEQLGIQLQIDEGLRQAIVPNMLLQPIVENSINHGYSKDYPTLKVEISIQQQNQNIVLIVKDNGRGFPTENLTDLMQSGMGLQNTYKRLQTLYNRSDLMRIRNLHPGAEVHITLPLSFAEATLI
ncbi:MAG: histidine kinase [Bacteroidota bacterium]